MDPQRSQCKRPTFQPDNGLQEFMTSKRPMNFARSFLFMNIPMCSQFFLEQWNFQKTNCLETPTGTDWMDHFHQHRHLQSCENHGESEIRNKVTCRPMEIPLLRINQPCPPFPSPFLACKNPHFPHVFPSFPIVSHRFSQLIWGNVTACYSIDSPFMTHS